MNQRLFSSPPLPAEVEAWLAEHPHVHRSSLEGPWRLADRLRQSPPAPDPVRKQAMWAQLEAALDQEPAAPARPERAPARRTALRPVTGLRLVRPLAAAAMVLLLVAAGLGLWLRPTTIQAPAGGRLAATLPDGTTVELNGRSSLTYDFRFSDERRVHLQGEAFFEVAHTGEPFVVETDNAETQVLGTQFNVRARASAVPETRVAVVTGRVQVTATGGDAPTAAVVLRAGEATVVAGRDRAPVDPAAAALEQTTAWRQGDFILEAEPLAVLFDEVEHRFGIDITAAEAIRAQTFEFAKHDVERPEDLLNDLCQALGLHYRATANGFEVYE